MRSTLASHSAVPRGANVNRMNADRAIRTAAQRTQGLWGLISMFLREIWRPTLAIRIAAVTLARDSAIIIARFRPSKKNVWYSLWTLVTDWHLKRLDPLGWHRALHAKVEREDGLYSDMEKNERKINKQSPIPISRCEQAMDTMQHNQWCNRVQKTKGRFF